MVDKNKFIDKASEAKSVKAALAREVEVPEDSGDFDLSEMYHQNSKYTAEEKMQAVVAYITTGTSKQAAKYCVVPPNTIRYWKASATWWPEAVAYARQMKQEELDARMTRVIDLAVGEVEDRLINGDEVVRQGGEIVRKKMGGKEAATTAAILFDKRALIRGEPTSRTERVSVDDQLNQLKDSFEKFSQEITRKVDAKVIDGERLMDDE